MIINKNMNKIASLRLYNLFLTYKDRPFVFVQRNGNFGDYLIWKGAEKLAGIAGIKYYSVNYKEFMREEYPAETVVYIHGGGGSNRLWTGNGVMNCLFRSIESHKGIVILGPETFCSDNLFLDNLKAIRTQDSKLEKLILFTRDIRSYEFLKDSVPKWIECQIDHDTALNLNIHDFEQIKLSNDYDLYAIRKDKEASDVGGRDYFAVWLDPVLHCHNFFEWLNLHAKASKITTNRLHSAVVGSILGKPTTLLPNNYHKNRAVWEYSLQARGVQWAENVKIKNWNRIINAVPTLRRVASSYKFQGTLQVFYGIR